MNSVERVEQSDYLVRRRIFEFVRSVHELEEVIEVSWAFLLCSKMT